MDTTASPSQQLRSRVAYGIAAVAATAGFAIAAAAAGVAWWAAGLLWLAPDLALLGGLGRGLEPGRLHPRNVPLYNALHRLHGPALLAAAAAIGIVPVVLPLAWASHVTVDRALGFGLRTRDGFQRG